MALDIEKLTSSLRSLPHRKQLAFAASVAERLLPNYEAFFRESGWGDPRVIRSGLDAVWAFVRRRQLSADVVQSLERAITKVTPEPGEFESALASAALDAANAVNQSLTCCLRQDPKKVAEIASFARDTIDMFIQVRDGLQYGGADFETHIERDPLMLTELRRQADALAWLRANELENSGHVDAFRSVAELSHSVIPVPEGQS